MKWKRSSGATSENNTHNGKVQQPSDVASHKPIQVTSDARRQPWQWSPCQRSGGKTPIIKSDHNDRRRLLVCRFLWLDELHNWWPHEEEHVSDTPIFETERLVLRRYSIGDVETLLPILSDPATMTFWPHPFTRDDVQNWIGKSIQHYERLGFGRYVIILKSGQEVIGDCGIWRLPLEGEVVNDLGYIIHHPYWRQGYATEAANAVKDYAFGHLQLDSLHANMPWNHTASRRVAERIGMTKVGEFVNERNRNIRTLHYVIYKPGSGTS